MTSDDMAWLAWAVWVEHVWPSKGEPCAGCNDTEALMQGGCAEGRWLWLIWQWNRSVVAA
jgi:hypothetical protein